jgi:hypothetical protein
MEEPVMAASVNPLARLVVDEAAVDLDLLASTLEDKIRLDLKQGGFAFLQGVRARLSSRQQVLTALLSQKALHLLDAQYPEALRPQEIENVTGVKGGTLRPILKVLTDGRVIRQDANKAYYVPGYAIEDAARFLGDRGE